MCPKYREESALDQQDEALEGRACEGRPAEQHMQYLGELTSSTKPLAAASLGLVSTRVEHGLYLANLA